MFASLFSLTQNLEEHLATVTDPTNCSLHGAKFEIQPLADPAKSYNGPVLSLVKIPLKLLNPEIAIIIVGLWLFHILNVLVPTGFVLVGHKKIIICARLCVPHECHCGSMVDARGPWGSQLCLKESPRPDS